MIYDWLIKKGDAKKDPNSWVDAIAQKTYGWPQHITAYGDAAAKQIQKDHGEMTHEGLEVVYQMGDERRKAYYKQRVDEIDGDELTCLYEAIAWLRSGTPFNKKLVLDPLVRKYESDEANKIFQKFITKGILSAVGTMYSVPIPSMHDWMRSELERAKEQIAALQDAQRAARKIKIGICVATSV